MFFEEIVKEFEKENPEIAEAMKLFNQSNEQYHNAMEVVPLEVVYITSLSTNGVIGDKKW